MGFADRKQERQGAGPLRPGVDSHLDRGNEEQSQSIEQKPGWCNMSLGKRRGRGRILYLIIYPKVTEF